MNIKTADRDFFVLHIAEKTPDYEYMVCVDRKQDNSLKYDILKIKDYSLICKIMPMLTAQRKNKRFSDFIDCFSQNNIFFAVFKHSDEALLTEYIEYLDYDIKERLEIFKSLTEKIAVMDNPLLTEVINSRSITVSDSFKVDFYYSHVSEYSGFDFKKFQKCFGEFTEEFFDIKCKSFSEYCEKLSNAEYEDKFEIYSDYLKIYDELKVEKKDKEKFSEKIGVKMIKPFIASLLIIMSLTYLIYFLTGYSQKDKSGYSTYKSIGTLVIDEYESND